VLRRARVPIVVVVFVGPSQVAGERNEQATGEVISRAPDRVSQGCAHGKPDQGHAPSKRTKIAETRPRVQPEGRLAPTAAAIAKVSRANAAPTTGD
jgi:hypothetical protein